MNECKPLAGGSGAGSGGELECPVCISEVDRSAAAAELAILPCGHRLCVSCTDVLVARAPPPHNHRVRHPSPEP